MTIRAEALVREALAIAHGTSSATPRAYHLTALADAFAESQRRVVYQLQLGIDAAHRGSHGRAFWWPYASSNSLAVASLMGSSVMSTQRQLG